MDNETNRTGIRPSVKRNAFHLRAMPVRLICAGESLSKLRKIPITPFEETNTVNRKPNDASSRRLFCMKSVMMSSTEAYNLGLGDSSFMEFNTASCTEFKGKNGTSENRKISVAGIAIKKLKDMAAARSVSLMSLMLLIKDEMTL